MKKITRRKVAKGINRLKVKQDYPSTVVVQHGKYQLEIQPASKNRLRLRYRGKEMGVVRLLPIASNTFDVEFMSYGEVFRRTKDES